MRLVHVDAFNYFYQQYSVNKATSENGEPIGAFIGLIDQVQRLANKFNPAKMIIYFDGPEAGKRRRAYLPEYKGKRGRRSRSITVKGMDDMRINNEDDQLKMAFEFLKQLPVTLAIVPYYEADDVIAHVVRKNPDYEHIICSSDKDYLQTITETTFVWSWGKKNLYDRNDVIREYGLPPENFVYYRCIVGDASDKLEGVPGIGPKTLLNIIPSLATDLFKNFDEFWKKVDEIEIDNLPQKKLQTAATTLKASEKQARLMYKIMDLQNGTLKQHAVERLQMQLEEQLLPSLSKIELQVYCLKKGLNHHIKNYSRWIRPFVFMKSVIELEA